MKMSLGEEKGFVFREKYQWWPFT